MATVVDIFDSNGYRAVRTALRANRLRQQVIASNVANIETPGYKTKDVNFDTIFEASSGKNSLRLQKTHGKHMSGLASEARFEKAIFHAYHPKDPFDGINDVDLDREMVKNSETTLNFKIYSQLIKGKYTSLREVIDSAI